MVGRSDRYVRWVEVPVVNKYLNERQETGDTESKRDSIKITRKTEEENIRFYQIFQAGGRQPWRLTNSLLRLGVQEISKDTSTSFETIWSKLLRKRTGLSRAGTKGGRPKVGPKTKQKISYRFLRESGFGLFRDPGSRSRQSLFCVFSFFVRETGITTWINTGTEYSFMEQKPSLN